MKTYLPTILLQLLLIAAANAQEVNMQLGSETVTMQVISDNRAIILPSNDVSVIRKLNEKGIKSLPRMPSANSFDSGDVVLMEVRKHQSKDFNDIISQYNRDAVKDIDVSTVLKYDNVFMVLTNKFIVSFKDDTNINDVEKYLADKKLELIGRDTLAGNQFYVKLRKDNPLDAVKNLKSYKTDNVLFFEPAFIEISQGHPSVNVDVDNTCVNTRRNHFLAPDDPLLEVQWYLTKVKALNAWQATHGSNSIIIAILDIGVDTRHPDLHQKIYRPFDAVGNDNDQEPVEGDNHGTACAGIAAAHTDNREGISGVGYASRIMPVRMAEPYGNYWLSSPDVKALAIHTAVDRGAKVISCSWTSAPHSKIEQAIDYAISKNCIMIFAAGNNNGAVDYPARLSARKNIIAVGATDEADRSVRPDTGGEGWGSNRGKEITVVAPGIRMCTTTISTPGDTSVDSNYVLDFNGTSGATPLVAGGIALMLSINPQLKPSQVVDIVRKNSDDLGANGCDPDFGCGRLNVSKLVDAVHLIAKP